MEDSVMKVDTATGASPPWNQTRDTACSPIRYHLIDRMNHFKNPGLASTSFSAEQLITSQANRNRSNANENFSASTSPSSTDTSTIWSTPALTTLPTPLMSLQFHQRTRPGESMTHGLHQSHDHNRNTNFHRWRGNDAHRRYPLHQSFKKRKHFGNRSTNHSNRFQLSNRGNIEAHHHSHENVHWSCCHCHFRGT